MVLIIIILSLLSCVLGYTTYNLLKKNEKQEDILTSYMLYLNKISNIIEVSDKKLKEIDAREIFKTDDEIGWFFSQVKEIQTILNSFNIKNL